MTAVFEARSKPPAFVLGGGINGLATVRSLGRLGVPVHLYTREPNDLASLSKYATETRSLDFSDTADVARTLIEDARRLPAKPVVLCTADGYLAAISAHRERLLDHCLINLPSSDAVDAVLDKGRFGDFCREKGLPAPRSWTVEMPEQTDEILTEITFPVIVKPVFAHAASGERFSRDGRVAKVLLGEDRHELRRIVSTSCRPDLRLLVQEYIEGVDSEHYSWCSYRDSRSRHIVGVGVRKLRLFPVHGGAGTFVELCDDAELAREGRRAIDALDYRGVASACFKRHARTGRLMLHEVNGRLPAWHAVTRLAGVDLPQLGYRDLAGETLASRFPTAGRGKWLSLNADLSALRDYRAAGELSLSRWLASVTAVRSVAEFAVDDWRPLARVARRFLRYRGGPGSPVHEGSAVAARAAATPAGKSATLAADLDDED